MMFIKIEHLVKSYRQKRVVNGVSLEVKQKEIVGLLGPNGAGKTTTFYMVVGLVRPDAGHVYLNGDDITKLPMHKRAQRGIGYLPQEPSIFRKLTVEENLLILFELMNISKDEAHSRLEGLLDELGIKSLRKQRSYELSGGEARRVEIARALATNPAFILLDEPFSGIDPITVSEIQETIRLLKDKGLGVLITDHNVRETLSITDRAYIQHKGQVIISGPSSEVAADTKAREFYLGHKFKLD